MIEMLIILACFAGACVVLFSCRRFYNAKKIGLRLHQHDAYLAGLKATVLPDGAPNIITILCDDMGYADISCFGATTIATPHIDQLARDGTVLTDFYSSAPVCSPSRAGFLTGRYPSRMFVNNVFFPKGTLIARLLSLIRFFPYGVLGLLPDEINIAEVLRATGYATGLVGKWHLGDFKPHRPNDRGFDFFYGSYYSNDMKPYAMYRNESIDIPAPADQDALTKNLTREAIRFIEENKERRFFLHFCQPFPHDPLHASDDFKGSSRAGTYGDAVQEVDWSIGQIMDALERHGLAGKTIVFFTSDNGPWHQGNPGYHRGRKGTTYEGGQRVPFIACWPGNIQASVKRDAASMNIDILPTLLEVLGLPLPEDRIIDGKSLLPVLTSKATSSPHDAIFYFWANKIQAIRAGTWKYHVKHTSDNANYFFVKVGPFLFNIQEDQNESYDLSMHDPGKALELSEKLAAMKSDMKRNPRGWI